MTAPDIDLTQLRLEYIERMKAHPPSTWSPNLLSVVINAVDLQFGDADAELPRRLRLVR